MEAVKQISQAVASAVGSTQTAEQKPKAEGKMSFCLSVFKNLALVSTGVVGTLVVIEYGDEGKKLLANLSEKLMKKIHAGAAPLCFNTDLFNIVNPYIPDWL